MKLLFCFFILFLGPLTAEITFTVEHARTDKEKNWGLMGRDSLPENHGLLIHFNRPTKIHLWMFNCQIPLSVAFLDNQFKILEIQDLQAHPEMMCYCPPISTVEDIEHIPADNLARIFFQERAIQSRHLASYALEMQQDWFINHGVSIGDRIEIRNLHGIVHKN